ncbi:Pre-rRNA-processing protein ESF1 [Hypsizygus marmoreus]|uniref:Pre-rRNA-processing protein ESF1 n=1 Tax=Hypsizygus marmoreus TaxID=39966 RepID=A0A369K6Z7_HYPMA|nr:Pre-rRNA-processing protein ESF1 [Hypsizygus marmoreus]
MSDPRFARLKSDPRFRRPRKKQTKVVVDDRFKGVFSQEKSKSGRVDKYGRSISDTHEKDNLKRFYQLENDEEEPESNPLLDYARGEVLLESSDEEEESDVHKDKDSELEEIGHNHNRPIAVSKDADAEIDLDETALEDLDAQAAAYSKANPESVQEETTPTRRLAVVNLDWEHVRASHLFKICSSLVSLTAPTVSAPSRERTKTSHQHLTTGALNNIVRGKVINVRVYPSEFGKERMAREEIEGPPPEIFKKKNIDDEEVNAQNIYQIGGEEDYDKDALRKYQLERLRYYYAIVTCDTVEAATHIYNELEGTELERSANVFDLSYVPDDMNFDAEFRDEATDDSNPTFKGVDFVTDALRHSKVKLTWDEDDPERNLVTRRKLSRKEIEEADFKAYLASSSSGSESESEVVRSAKSRERQDRNATRDKLRALLLGGDDDLPEGWGREEDGPDDVDMEITFTPGLSEKRQEDETTLDKYQRKMREKRKKRKEEVKEKAVNGKEIIVDDDFFDAASDEEASDEETTSQGKKQTRKTIPSRATRPPTTPEELALLVASDKLDADAKHFDLKAVLKAEKKSRRKGKKGKQDKEEDDNETQPGFVIDVKDDRFKMLHEDHQFAIDPSNPHFKKTSAMDALLKERSKRQKELLKGSDVTPGNNLVPTGEKSLKNLVESVKRKSTTSRVAGTGKRRKL